MGNRRKQEGVYGVKEGLCNTFNNKDLYKRRRVECLAHVPVTLRRHPGEDILLESNEGCPKDQNWDLDAERFPRSG